MFPDPVTYAIPVFVLSIALELYLVHKFDRGQYERRDTIASLSMGLGNFIIGLLAGTALAYAAFNWVFQFRLIDTIPVTAGTVLLCLLLDDFAYYWFHRIAHERRWFWASHVVHHSSQHYNLSTALRQTWTGKLSFSFVFSLPLALMGFPVEMIFFVGGVNLVYQFWIHTELVDRIGPLEWVLNTPSHHRVHHGTNPRYLDANYAGMLIIWDRMFGTFVAERRDESPDYGIIKNVDTYNPFRIAFHEWQAMIQDVRSAKNFKEVAGFMFGPPGWSPDGSRDTTAKIKQRWRQAERTRLTTND